MITFIICSIALGLSTLCFKIPHYSFQQFFNFLPIIPKIILDKNQPSTLNLLNLHIYHSYKEHNITFLTQICDKAHCSI